MKRLLASLLFCFAASVVYADDIIVSAGDVRDKRATDQFYSGLELQLKIAGDIVYGAKGIKAKILAAVDDTGRDLLKEEENKDAFTELGEYSHSGVTINLKNPARKASVIKELSGKISIFIPQKDTKSTVVIKNFMSKTGKPLSDPSMKAEGVEITVLTKDMYEKIKAEKEKKAKTDAAAEFGSAMVEAFSAMFGGMMSTGKNAIFLHIKDPGAKIIAMGFLDEKGEKVKSFSSMTMNDMKIFDFDKPMPPKAQITVHIATSQSLISKQFKLTDIALP